MLALVRRARWILLDGISVLGKQVTDRCSRCEMREREICLKSAPFAPPASPFSSLQSSTSSNEYSVLAPSHSFALSLSDYHALICYINIIEMKYSIAALALAATAFADWATWPQNGTIAYTSGHSSHCMYILRAVAIPQYLLLDEEFANSPWTYCPEGPYILEAFTPFTDRFHSHDDYSRWNDL